MKLSTNTVNILSNFASINEGIVFRKGRKQATISLTGTIISVVELEEDLPRDFSIYDLNQFLAILNIVNNPELEFEDEHVKISGEGQIAKFRYSSPGVIKSHDPTKTLDFDKCVGKINLTKDILNRVNKAAALFKAPYLAIESTDGKVVIKTYNDQDLSSSSMKIDIAESDNQYRIVLRPENLKILSGDYVVEIAEIASKKGEKGLISKFTNTSLPLFYYIPGEKQK